MPVRVTLHPAEDVELPDGARLGDLRAPLADLLRRPELLDATLHVDGHVLDDDARAGRRPLLPGAVVCVGAPTAGPTAPDLAGLRAAWFVAAASGPEAGVPVPLRRDAPALLGSPHRVSVRLDRRDRAWVRRAPRDRAGDAARSAVTMVRAGRRRRRRLGPGRQRWRTHHRLEVDGVIHTLHRSGDAVAWLAPEPSRSPSAPTVGTGVLLAGLVPVAGSLALAATFRQPLYALFSLVAMVAIAPQLVAAARRRRAAAGEDSPHPSGPAGSDPVRTAVRTAAAHQASEGAWRRARTTLSARQRDSGAQVAAPVLAEMLPDDAVAVLGPATLARAAARSVVVDLAAAGAGVRATGSGRHAWAWTRWIAGGDDVPLVQLVDSPGPRDLRDATASRRAGDIVVLCLPQTATRPGRAEGTPGGIPSWCRSVIEVGTDGTARRTWPDGSTVTEPMTGVSAATAELVARRLAGLRALRRPLGALDAAAGAVGADPTVADPTIADPTAPGLPGAVALTSLLDPGRTAERWSGPATWSVPLGLGAHADPVHLDLVRDGPHVLVGGTTGSGKSELLQTLVLGLALTRSPTDLALALVDFKGGSSFGRCADLPHVVGQVTDLEPGLAGRALSGLRAELRRREHLLAEHGARDVAELVPGTLPRVVVVIDEFRALADDLPDFLPGLLRIAAQGRSLGVHLVLATQRPAGAVSGDLRANVSARVALRVVDAADSTDVVDAPVAAGIPLDAPGRAVLRVGAAPPVVLQCAHAGTLPDADRCAVRRAPAWPGPRQVTDDPDSQDGHAPATDPVRTLVEGVRHLAARRGCTPGPAPWLPPLPARIDVAELPPGLTSPAPPGTLPLALADDPEHQRQVLVSWDPSTGHLAVLGHARSGRTTTLCSLAVSALTRGWHVHALVPDASNHPVAALREHPGFGTLAGPEEPRRARRLLALLASRGDGPTPTLVVVDGVEDLRAAVSAGQSWDPLAAGLSRRVAAFAVSADTASVGGMAARVGPRLVLLSADQHADVVLGAPSSLAGSGTSPGRAAWLGRTDPLRCQVLLAQDVAPGRMPEATWQPHRVLPLPARVSSAELDGAEDARRVAVGLGGDAAEPVRLDISAGSLVVGPRGSGRSTVLCTITRALARQGRVVAVIARDPALAAGTGAAPSVLHSPSAVRDLVERLAEDPGVLGSGVVVVDDLDALAHTCPVETDRLGALADSPDVPWVLVASATVQGALLAHRGPLAELRGRRTGIVLAPAERGAEEVFGTRLDEVVEPGAPQPGRAAVVHGGEAVAVQCAIP